MAKVENSQVEQSRASFRTSVRPTSYSGADFNIWAYFPIIHKPINTELTEDPVLTGFQKDLERALANREFSAHIPLTNLQTVTSSYASSLSAVEECGSSLPVDHTRGQKTYAGTLVFTVFDKEPLANLLYEGLGEGFPGVDASSEYLSFDQMLPFNLVIQANSELPTKRGLPQSMMKVIVGVRFMTGGETITIDDFFLEQQHQYVARYVSPWLKVVPESSNEATASMEKKLSDLLKNPRTVREN